MKQGLPVSTTRFADTDGESTAAAVSAGVCGTLSLSKVVSLGNNAGTQSDTRANGEKNEQPINGELK